MKIALKRLCGRKEFGQNRDVVCNIFYNRLLHKTHLNSWDTRFSPGRKVRASWTCHYKGLEPSKGEETVRVGTCPLVLSKWKQEEEERMLLGSMGQETSWHTPEWVRKKPHTCTFLRNWQFHNCEWIGVLWVSEGHTLCNVHSWCDSSGQEKA